METPDPPNDIPGALKQVVLTPHDIRILRAGWIRHELSGTNGSDDAWVSFFGWASDHHIFRNGLYIYLQEHLQFRMILLRRLLFVFFLS